MKIHLQKTVLLLVVCIVAICVQAKSLDHILLEHQADVSASLSPSLNPEFYGPHLEDEDWEQEILDHSLVIFDPYGFISFREALGFKESQGRYWAVNTLGYMGKYQFGCTTLEQLGVYNFEQFLSSPRLQERVFEKNIRYNRKQLASYIRMYNGKTVGGVKITESGILAAAHLSGAGGVKRFLKSGGDIYTSDAYGTTVRGYLKKFSGYDLRTS